MTDITPEQITAVIVAVTGLVAALGAIFVQVRATHTLVNSRMTELITTTKLASTKAGELAGRDFRTQATAEADPATPPLPPTS